jgi:hypothetical protein
VQAKAGYFGNFKLFYTFDNRASMIIWGSIFLPSPARKTLCASLKNDISNITDNINEE